MRSHSTTLSLSSNLEKNNLSVHQGNFLHIAARHGDLHLVKHLIDKGTDINVRDDDGVRQEFILISVYNS